jgi:hypothetical protein
MGRERYSLSKRIKMGIRGSLGYIRDFEKSTVSLAIENGCDFVVCGHIHQPKKEIHISKKGQCTYLNSGDWVENLTALEYSLKRWKIYRYNQDKLSPFFADEELKEMDIHELIAAIASKNDQKEGRVSMD